MTSAMVQQYRHQTYINLVIRYRAVLFIGLTVILPNTYCENLYVKKNGLLKLHLGFFYSLDGFDSSCPNVANLNNRYFKSVKSRYINLCVRIVGIKT